MDRLRVARPSTFHPIEEEEYSKKQANRQMAMPQELINNTSKYG